jgi:hypothetical protein
MLTLLDFDVVKLGKVPAVTSKDGLVAAGGSKEEAKDKSVEEEEVVEA